MLSPEIFLSKIKVTCNCTVGFGLHADNIYPFPKTCFFLWVKGMESSFPWLTWELPALWKLWMVSLSCFVTWGASLMRMRAALQSIIQQLCVKTSLLYRINCRNLCWCLLCCWGGLHLNHVVIFNTKINIIILLTTSLARLRAAKWAVKFFYKSQSPDAGWEFLSFQVSPPSS